MELKDLIRKRILRYLNEGGNITVRGVSAEKIDFQKIPIREMREKFFKLFEELNKLYYKEYNEYLWRDMEAIRAGVNYNGSTSFILNPDYDEDEIVKYKKSSGDVDITISEDCKEKLWRLLEKYEDKKIGDFTYIGNNRNSEDALGDQINAIFRYENKNGATNCQVDFEYAKYSKGRQSEWNSFSHSSSFEDARERVKGVFHKQLLACIARSLSVNPNIVIATNASTPEKIRLKKDDGRVPATQSFSVVHGLGTKLTPMLKDGAPVYLDGKQVYKEIRADDYTTNLESIFKALFKKKGDIKDMRSFVGVCRLLKTQPKKFVKEVLENFVYSMFSVKAGRVDNNLESDYEVKDNAYRKFVEITDVKLDDYEEIRDNYYNVNRSKFK